MDKKAPQENWEMEKKEPKEKLENGKENGKMEEIRQQKIWKWIKTNCKMDNKASKENCKKKQKQKELNQSESVALPAILCMKDVSLLLKTLTEKTQNKKKSTETC